VNPTATCVEDPAAVKPYHIERGCSRIAVYNRRLNTDKVGTNRCESPWPIRYFGV
jgi:hypothetical protein